MSNHSVPQAPSYWGPPNYTQQWNTNPSSTPSSTSHSVPLNQGPSLASQPLPNNGGQLPGFQNLDNFYANAAFPGLGGPSAPGSQPFPSWFWAGAAPPVQSPSPKYPFMYLLDRPQPGATPGLPSATDMLNTVPQDAPASQPMDTSNPNQDFDREEGELTDMEGPVSARSPRGPPHDRGARRPPRTAFRPRDHQKGPKEKHYTKQIGAQRIQSSRSSGPDVSHLSSTSTAKDEGAASSDLEEGEASPEPYHSSRDSGSPYNPPMPMDIGSPPGSKLTSGISGPSKPSLEQPADVNSSVTPSTKSPISQNSSKSIAQLRVQAQGALLSLAPHSIRYTELVGEGIDPDILKQLYEEVGIKVPTHDQVPTPIPPVPSDDSNLSEIIQASVNGRDKQQTELPEIDKVAPVQPTCTEAAASASKSNLPNTAKPMERKEVIARMLAAKAAQASKVSAPSQTGAPKTATNTQLPATVADESVAPAPSQDIPSKEKEVRGKEKNKAQTELARQRIELLKKQGLMRQQKSQQDLGLPDKEQRTTIQDLVQPPDSTGIQHPLPERPPDPESAASAGIPGLFMAEQALDVGNGAFATPIQPGVEPTPQSRASQRKRPRASDFDEPIPVPKRTFSNGTNHAPPQRLVIDISEDEFYSDNEDDSMDMDETVQTTSQDSSVLATEGTPRIFPPSIDSLPHRPATSQGQALSASITPQNLRNSEQEDLRRKNLEIQAMHRKIAELEQRQKARLASRTQSPRTADISPPDSSTPAHPDTITIPSAPEPSESEISDKKVDEIIAIFDAEGLKNMKAKLLRKEELEAGVPSLDAEIAKTESKLGDFKREEEKLLLEIARGKEGRQHLLEELDTLKSELKGLSLDQVNSALIKFELEEKSPIESDQAKNHEQESLNIEITPVAEASTTNMPSPEIATCYQELLPLAQDVLPTGPQLQISNNLAVARAVTDEELHNSSESEDSGSSMDESSDSSSSVSSSSDEEMSSEEVHHTASPELESTAGSQEPSLESMQEDVILHHENSIAETQPPSQLVSNAGQEDVIMTEKPVSRKSSVSEAYEPPEPEESSYAESTYSPSFSPVSPRPMADEEASRSPQGQRQEAGEPLTGKVQELDFQQPSHYSQNEKRPEDSERKYAPYISPLKLFKAYRYHPKYTDNVSGGYRSLTYSHNIDSMKYLCPFEAAGGVCNDRSCEFQHFRDMALSDDKILVQMGSLREGKTPEESDNYIAGLKQIINDMRRDKVKDFNTVATEIAAYRRRFLQDPSRVLAL